MTQTLQIIKSKYKVGDTIKFTYITYADDGETLVRKFDGEGIVLATTCNETGDDEMQAAYIVQFSYYDEFIVGESDLLENWNK